MNTQPTSPMKASLRSAHPHAAENCEWAWGVVHTIDLVARDITVLLENGPEAFDVPPDCRILLRGEPIKLRMVQPRDHVWITFQRTPERCVVAQLEVQPDMNFSWFQL